MRRTILALTLTLTLSSALPVRASAPVGGPSSNPAGGYWGASDIDIPTTNFTTPVGNIWANSNISLYYAVPELFALGF